jgi:hypothetical protein
MVFGMAFEVPTSAFRVSRPKGDITIDEKQIDPNNRKENAGVNIVQSMLSF